MIEAKENMDRYVHLSSGRSSAAIRGAAWSGINAIVPSIVSAVVFTLTSRVLGPAEFGLVAFAVGINSLLSAIAPTGFGDALVQRRVINERHLSTVFWLCLAAGFIAFGLIGALAYPISVFTSEPLLRFLLPVLGLKVIFDMASTVPNAVLTRTMSFNLVALRTTVASVVAGVVCLGLLVSGYGIWALALSQVAGSAASCVGSMTAAKWWPRSGFDVSNLQDLRRYGLFASAGRLVQLVYPDQILIGALVGPAALGLFGFSRRLFQLLNDVIAGALTSVSHVLLSSLQTETEKLREAFLVSSFVSAAISFAIFGGLAVVAPDAVPQIFGQQWVSAVAPVQAFCVIGVISSIGYLQSALINSQGHADWWFWYQSCKQVVLLLTILISYRFGITAIVISMAAASLAIWPATLFKSSRLLNLRVVDYLYRFAPPAASCLLMMSTVLVARATLPEIQGSARIVSSILIGALTYSCAMFLLSGRQLLSVLKLVSLSFRRT